MFVKWLSPVGLAICGVRVERHFVVRTLVHPSISVWSHGLHWLSVYASSEVDTVHLFPRQSSDRLLNELIESGFDNRHSSTFIINYCVSKEVTKISSEKGRWNSRKVCACALHGSLVLTEGSIAKATSQTRARPIKTRCRRIGGHELNGHHAEMRIAGFRCNLGRFGAYSRVIGVVFPPLSQPVW